MAIDPNVLQMISNPTGGRLGEIGETIAKNRQQSIENNRAAESDDMKKRLFQQKMADVGSKIVGAYSDINLKWKQEHPDATDTDFEQQQLAQWESLDPEHQQFVPKTFQTPEQLAAGKSRSEEIQKALHPELYAKEPKSSFDIVTLQDPNNPEHELSFHKDDKAEVAKKLDEGWVERGSKGINVNVGGEGQTEYEKQRLKQQAVDIGEATKSAESAYNNIVSLKRFKESSKDGYEGNLAPILTGARNFVASFGYDSEKLKDTRYMEQAIGEMQAQKMKELGARGLTDKDMEILARALPRVETDKASREAIADILIKANSRVIDSWESDMNEEKKIWPELSSRIRQPSWHRMYKEDRENSETFKKANAILNGEP